MSQSPPPIAAPSSALSGELITIAKSSVIAKRSERYDIMFVIKLFIIG